MYVHRPLPPRGRRGWPQTLLIAGALLVPAASAPAAAQTETAQVTVLTLAATVSGSDVTLSWAADLAVAAIERTDASTESWTRLGEPAAGQMSYVDADVAAGSHRYRLVDADGAAGEAVLATVALPEAPDETDIPGVGDEPDEPDTPEPPPAGKPKPNVAAPVQPPEAAAPKLPSRAGAPPDHGAVAAKPEPASRKLAQAAGGRTVRSAAASFTPITAQPSRSLRPLPPVAAVHNRAQLTMATARLGLQGPVAASAAPRVSVPLASAWPRADAASVITVPTPPVQAFTPSHTIPVSSSGGIPAPSPVPAGLAGALLVSLVGAHVVYAVRRDG